MSVFTKKDKNSVFSCDVNHPPNDYKEKAIRSYEMYGVFFLRKVLAKDEIKSVRKDLDHIFNESGDKRQRCVSEIKDDLLQSRAAKVFMSTNALNFLEYVFSDTDVSLLPPFQISKNYLPHTVYTEAMGWHRDVNGELAIKQCRTILEDPGYTFGKIGLYLQDNSEYGGAIDVVTGSNRDFLHFPKGWSKATFWIKFLIFLQRYTPFFYKKIANTKIMTSLIGMTKTNIKAGDAVIFDSRVFHKGTPASVHIEKNLIYHHDSLQAELPEAHTKYAFYSHFGNSIGVKSYFLDRLSRDGGENEVDEWIDDTEAVNSSLDSVHTFFRKKRSLLDDSFKDLFI